MFGDTEGSREKRGDLLRRYDAYLQVLRANADAIELLSELEELQAAGSPCGRRMFRAMVTRLGVQVYAMARMLQVLAGERYEGLHPAIDRIRRSLDDALKEEQAPQGEVPWTLPLGQVASQGEGAFGGKAHNLARLKAAGIPVPEGFAVSLRAFRSFLEHNGLDVTVRILSDTLDPDEPAHLAESAERLRRAVLEGALPAVVLEEIRKALASLAPSLPLGARFAVRSSATGEDAAFSFAGQYSSVLGVAPEDVPAAYVKVLAGFFNPRAVLLRLKRGYGALELGMGALVLPMVDARVSGVSYSRDPVGTGGGGLLVEAVPGAGAALVGGRVTPGAWIVDRGSGAVLDRSPPGAQAPPISAGEIASAAELARRTEEVLGVPADVEWAVDQQGRLWLLQGRPLALAPPAPPEEEAPLDGHRVLAEGGVRASSGAGCGPVAKVRSRDEALLLPQGSVMVAAEALPDLALALSRAVAVVTERGGVTGHLASTAREFGVPALFGLAGAVALLEEGARVTVDATGCRVYEGEVRALLDRRSASAPARVPGTLGALMERTLPLVLPLTLRDPGSERFTPEHCQTLHDVVRFIHEKALAETVGVGDASGGGGGPWVRVDEPLPFEFRLVPLEGGLESPAGQKSVRKGQVTSVPARALLKGMLDPAVKRTGPPPVDAAGFMSVLSASAAGQDADLGGATWAMISDRYLQLSSRIGYHFTTLEAFAGAREQDNRVRFIFKGGAADDTRRMRRARFIARILEGLGFQVTVKGDFVSGTYGQASAEKVAAVLEDIGRLLVCANRLDMLLAEEALAAWYADAFLRGDYRTVLDGERPPRD
jgi:pyruvate,water dikinase